VQIPMQSFMTCMGLSVANENDVCRQSQEAQKKNKDTEQTPQTKVSKYRI